MSFIFKSQTSRKVKYKSKANIVCEMYSMPWTASSIRFLVFKLAYIIIYLKEKIKIRLIDSTNTVTKVSSNKDCWLYYLLKISPIIPKGIRRIDRMYLGFNHNVPAVYCFHNAAFTDFWTDKNILCRK